jgi:uncharacterized membrane protein YesL
MKRDRYPPDMALYQRYVRIYWRQYRLKWLSWLVAGVYTVILGLWLILDPYGFREVEGLLYIPGIFIGIFVLLTTVKEKEI